MTGLLVQYIREVAGYADGDLAHSPLGAVTGMGLDPSGLPPFDGPVRLLVRGRANALHCAGDRVVGFARAKKGIVATYSGTTRILTSTALTEAAAYWVGHELVMADGAAQGQSQRVLASAVGSVTLRAAFTDAPVAADNWWILPQRVTAFPGLGEHAADSFYYYAVRELSTAGRLGRCSNPIRMEFGGGGAYQAGAPNPVRHVHAQQLATGHFRLRWLYPVRGQGGYPQDFRVYGDEGTGTVDYNTPLVDSETGLSTVVYRAPGAVYAFTTKAYADGLEVIFGVKARSAAAVEQVGTVETLPIEALGVSGPPAPPKFVGVETSSPYPSVPR